MPLFKFRKIAAKKFNDAEIKRLVRNAVFRVGRAVKRDFESTTKSWSTRPTFKLSTSIVAAGPHFSVTVDDWVYKWVNDGTQEHFIGPIRGRTLAYQKDFNPKTSPGIIGSSSGGKSGQFVFPKGVANPGIEARNFEAMISEKWKPLLKAEIEAAIREGVTLSGHKL